MLSFHACGFVLVGKKNIKKAIYTMQIRQSRKCASSRQFSKERLVSLSNSEIISLACIRMSKHSGFTAARGDEDNRTL